MLGDCTNWQQTLQNIHAKLMLLDKWLESVVVNIKEEEETEMEDD